MTFSMALERVRQPMLLCSPARKRSHAKALARVIAGVWMSAFMFAVSANLAFAQAPSGAPADKAKPDRPAKPSAPPQSGDLARVDPRKGVYALSSRKKLHLTYAGRYENCLTHDRAVLSDPKTPKRNYRHNFPCLGLVNGHAFSGSEMCRMWVSMWSPTSLSDYKIITYPGSDSFASFRGCDLKDSGPPMVNAPLVCERYAKTKLGLVPADTSTFVRWNAQSFDTVCFFVKKSYVRAYIEDYPTRKDRAERWAKAAARSKLPRKQYASIEIGSSNSGIGKFTRRVYEEQNTVFELNVHNTTPKVGNKLVDLARIDPDSAAKYIGWLNDSIDSETVMWNPDKMAKTAIGHGHNARVFEQTLNEIKKNIKIHRKILETKYNDYFHEKNAENKSIKHDIYIKNTKKHKALKQLKSAMDELVDITRKKDGG